MAMLVEFRKPELEDMLYDPKYRGSWPAAVVKAYHKVVNWVKQSVSSQDLRGKRSLRFEKLKGKRKHQCSLRLNNQYRLIVELRSVNKTEVVRIIDIEDYH